MSKTLIAAGRTANKEGTLSWWNRLAYGCGDTACNIAVSYTHLDVYKRQALSRADQ